MSAKKKCNRPSCLDKPFDDVFDDVTHQEQGGELSREHMERLYVFALMWSVGALLELDDRMKMEQWLRHHDNIRLDLPNIPPHSEDTMFDFYVTNDGI